MLSSQRKYTEATQRWAGVGPYYAMFPTAFADEVVNRYSTVGDTILDPFAGRGTAIFSASVHDRIGIGIELNPVGWVYAQAKLHTASEDDVASRLDWLGEVASDYKEAADQLPPFFHHCFSSGVRSFLLAARERLDWRRKNVDRTAMALLLVNMHGKREASLSNQMRQTKSMSPDYAIRWWQERKLSPPEIDPVQFMKKKLRWRYAHGIPRNTCSQVYLGNSTRILPEIKRILLKRRNRLPIKLLLTSPPYYGVTNYHYDQWLRLWLLGHPPNALRVSGVDRGKFENRDRYKKLLTDVFSKSASLLQKDAIIYVRTDFRDFTQTTTESVLREVFSRKRLVKQSQPVMQPTQTDLFGHHGEDRGEVDIILLPK